MSAPLNVGRAPVDRLSSLQELVVKPKESTGRDIYLIGSLRNPRIPEIGNALRRRGHRVYDDWFATGPEADDYWKKYSQTRGDDFLQALTGWAATHIYHNDKQHLDEADTGILVLPAGKSGHLELGYMIGQGKRGYILLPEGGVPPTLPAKWERLTGLYEGEGTITRNGRRGGHGMQLSITMTDEDVVRWAYSVAGRGAVEGPYRKKGPRAHLWKSQWRWVVRKKADVLYVVNGLLEGLAIRRRSQISKVLSAAGVSPRELDEAETPYEARYDVMYKFATGVFNSESDLIEGVS